MLLSKGPSYSLKKSLGLITLSSLLISGAAWCGILFYHFLAELQSKKKIIAIVQTHPPKSLELPTSFFAEYLDLSRDHPTPASFFSLEEARERLWKLQLFKHLTLKKMKTEILHIDYSLKEALAKLGNLSHTLIDDEGNLFPELLFFAPRHYPIVFAEELNPKHLEILLHIFNQLDKDSIRSVDLSRITAPSEGKREIIITLNNGLYLRLSPNNYHEQLIFFKKLEDQLKECHTVDLRISKIAFIG